MHTYLQHGVDAHKRVVSFGFQHGCVFITAKHNLFFVSFHFCVADAPQLSLPCMATFVIFPVLPFPIFVFKNVEPMFDYLKIVSANL